MTWATAALAIFAAWLLAGVVFSTAWAIFLMTKRRDE
jgi:hypothetical protein